MTWKRKASNMQMSCRESFFLSFFETVLQSEMSSDVLLWRLIHQMCVYIKECFGSDVDSGGQAGGCINNTSD